LLLKAHFNIRSLGDVDNVVTKEKEINTSTATPSTNSTATNKNETEISASDVSQQVDDLLQKFGPSQTATSNASPVNISQDFDVSAYISANTQNKPKGLFD